MSVAWTDPRGAALDGLTRWDRWSWSQRALRMRDQQPAKQREQRIARARQDRLHKREVSATAKIIAEFDAALLAANATARERVRLTQWLRYRPCQLCGERGPCGHREYALEIEILRMEERRTA